MLNSNIQNHPVNTRAVATLPLMAHWVLGYPTLPESERIILELAEAGVQYLELQIPFSHPTADGPLITAANRTALASGTTLHEALAVVARIKAAYPAQHIVLMTYTNKVSAFGYEAFARQALQAGATGLILPDLPFDALEADKLRAEGIQLIPVLGPNISDERLQILLKQHPKLVYRMAGYKITGSSFGLDVRLAGLVQTLRNAGAKVGIGFGISTPGQVQAVLEIADFAIIGSSLLNAYAGTGVRNYLLKVKSPNHL